MSGSDGLERFPTSSQLENELKRVKSKSEFVHLLRNTVSSLLVVAALAVLISLLFLPVLRVTGSSMSPTLQNDELVVCRKTGSFEQGDVVAFYYNNKILIKRVIAVAGDVVNIESDGTVYVNGVKINEPYLESKAFGECDIEMPYQVPDERIFVMGDNRETSIDSRSSVIGCIADESVVGKVSFRIWPLDSAGLL